jgi:hypothetical protein
VFSLDAKSILDSFNMYTHDRTELGSILSNCRSMISSLCNNSYVEFIRREANMVSHNLSKAAMYNAILKFIMTFLCVLILCYLMI